jgi:hypothetical protein
MKYMLLMSTTRTEHQKGMARLTKQDLQALVAHMRGFAKEIDESGELVETWGLSFPDEAKLVRAGNDGLPVTDGIFPESKEFLAGFWIVDVPGPDDAYRIAARVSQGPLGTIPIEVRQIMESAPKEWE